jgi:hypothetical protein
MLSYTSEMPKGKMVFKLEIVREKKSSAENLDLDKRKNQTDQFLRVLEVTSKIQRMRKLRISMDKDGAFTKKFLQICV